MGRMQLCHVLLAVFALCQAQGVSSEVVTRAPGAAQLHQIFEDSWDEDMRRSPVWASMLGDHRFNDQWQNLSGAAFAQRAEQNAAVLKRLESIDLERLSEADRVNYELFFQAYSERAAAAEHPTHLMPISQRGGIQTLDETGDRLGLQSVQDFEDWLARLEQIDVLMDQTIDLMTQGIEQGYVPPKITMGRVPAQIEKQLVAQATDSLFYKPFKQMPAAMAALGSSPIAARRANGHCGQGNTSLRKALCVFYRDLLSRLPSGYWGLKLTQWPGLL